MKKQVYFENLDGLRFFCFLSVYLFHCFTTQYDTLVQTPAYVFIRRDLFYNANIGVNFFFVLSGFLITYLLLSEKNESGNINLKKFWLRRILRIWPLFYVCVFYGFILYPALKNISGQEFKQNASLIYYLTFTNNFDFVLNGVPNASVLSVLWSIAVEEQFYLFWPVLILFFPVDKLWFPFAVIILASLIFRFLHDNYMFRTYHSFSCMGDMAMGALGAWLVTTSVRFKLYIEDWGKKEILLVYISFFLIYFFRDEVLPESYVSRILERFILSISIVLIILEQCYSKNSFFKLSGFRIISKLGTWTYGMYCLHFICIQAVTQLTARFSFNTKLWQVLILEPALGLALTIAASYLSFQFFERHFLNLKEKFG